MADVTIAAGKSPHSHSPDGEYHSYLENTGKHRGILAWILSTDHKRIGILYLISIFTFFAVGVVLGFLMRLEMLVPGPAGKIFNAQEYNALFTLHGVIMVFLFVIPGIPATLGNFFLPIQIGAKDVAFPRLNLLSWYLYITGAIVIMMSMFWHGLPDTGWTFYVPYSIRTGTDVTMAVFGVFILGFSSILTGLNFLTTIHRLRAPGMSFFRMPLFVWALYATAWIQVIATPVLAITLLLIVIERVFSVGIFNPTLGGDPVLYQHLFWIYSHPRDDVNGVQTRHGVVESEEEHFTVAFCQKSGGAWVYPLRNLFGPLDILDNKKCQSQQDRGGKERRTQPFLAALDRCN